MRLATSWPLAVLSFAAVVTWGACSAGAGRAVPSATTSAAPEAVDDATVDAPRLHGRLDDHGGLRVLRLWGSPRERGEAHGFLMAEEIVAIMNEEFAARFADRKELLEQARAALPRLIEYPDDVRQELAALYEGLTSRGVDRSMPALGREFDETDLLVANALDVFGLMGCSSFTVWGGQVAGGGVLTARNFDWPLTGDHMLQHTILIVQEPDDGHATASIAWPGYVGTVTGVSDDGVVTYLHVGSARFAMPQPSSWPSAVAARRILEAGARADALDNARDLLEYTSPPAGFLTHVVLPEPPADGGSPAVLFETDAGDCMPGAPVPGPFVVTNHFRTRDDGRPSSSDSRNREALLQKGIAGCIAVGDRVVDVDEAWRILSSVEAGGGHHFGTLHAIVFRHDPWYLEVRVAEHRDDGLVAAPSSARRHVLPREVVFGR